MLLLLLPRQLCTATHFVRAVSKFPPPLRLIKRYSTIRLRCYMFTTERCLSCCPGSSQERGPQFGLFWPLLALASVVPTYTQALLQGVSRFGSFYTRDDKLH